MDKFKQRWGITSNWQVIIIFIVFSVTGSASLFVGKPIIKLLGISKDNLEPILYWTLYIFVGFIFYQILLVLIGWIFGQFTFFWNMEKKMLKRMGLGFLLKGDD